MHPHLHAENDARSFYFFSYLPFPHQLFHKEVPYHAFQTVLLHRDKVSFQFLEESFLAYGSESKGKSIPKHQIGKSGSLECLLDIHGLKRYQLCSWDNKILIAIPESVISNYRSADIFYAPTTYLIKGLDVGKVHAVIRFDVPPEDPSFRRKVTQLLVKINACFKLQLTSGGILLP